MQIFTRLICFCDSILWYSVQHIHSYQILVGFSHYSILLYFTCTSSLHFILDTPIIVMYLLYILTCSIPMLCSPHVDTLEQYIALHFLYLVLHPEYRHYSILHFVFLLSFCYLAAHHLPLCGVCEPSAFTLFSI